MKKVYSTPKAVAEEFEANEYVAACWGVACATSSANSYEQSIYVADNVTNYAAGQTHADDHCGYSGNQKITTSNGTPIAMTECGTSGLGNLSCTLYTDSTYSTPMSVSSVYPGEYIFWTTSSGSRVWHHQGTVTETYPGHPNRS